MKEGYCHLWHEAEGGLTAHEFFSIIVRFVSTQCLSPRENQTCKKVILYSDGCCYQNRNAVLTNALLHISMLKSITIEQKYLVRGHTQMEVDSMHSSIECVLRNRNINLPSDYVTACQEARAKPKPYNVCYLEHSYFKDFRGVQIYNSIRPGSKVGDPTVTDIRALRYSPDGSIHYKLRFSEDWTLLPHRRSKVTPREFEMLPQLYTERLNISKTKFDHFQSLKNSMHADHTRSRISAKHRHTSDSYVNL